MRAFIIETLKRPKTRNLIKSERVEITLQVLHSLGVLFTPKACQIQLPDSEDRIYLDLAIAAGAQFVITGNKKHFPEKLCKGIKILSPAEFLQRNNDLLL